LLRILLCCLCMCVCVCVNLCMCLCACRPSGSALCVCWWLCQCACVSPKCFKTFVTFWWLFWENHVITCATTLECKKDRSVSSFKKNVFAHQFKFLRTHWWVSAWISRRITDFNLSSHHFWWWYVIYKLFLLFYCFVGLETFTSCRWGLFRNWTERGYSLSTDLEIFCVRSIRSEAFVQWKQLHMLV
jgi:hypothetical protein